VIGRSPGSDIVIGDDFVSALHAKIYQKGNEVVVEDLGSTNGTILNGDRLRTPSTLRPGDTIDIGTVRLEVDRG
jgi:pSer/pThr/pTyr-binding forkhead associated (FHA) protein